MTLNVAAIILYDSDDRLLLQHRTSDAERLPGYWAFFGGEIAEGENPIAAARREAFEELNCSLNNPEFVFEQDFELDGIEGHIWVYVDAFNNAKSILKLQEGQAWGWYAAAETEALKVIDHDRAVIKKVDGYLKKKRKQKAPAFK